MIGKKITDLELIQKIKHEDVLLVQTPDGARQININNMVMSNGVKGPTGDKGPRGDKGHTGDFGNIGPTGSKGLVGNKGLTGDKGPKGDVGDKGPLGPTGITGLTGDKGPGGSAGQIGVKGPKGDKGAAGNIDNKAEVDELKGIVDINHEEILDCREDTNHLLYENWNISYQPFSNNGSEVIIEDSKVGRTKDVKLEGNTVQNLILGIGGQTIPGLYNSTTKTITFKSYPTGSGVRQHCDFNCLLKPGTKYTLIFNYLTESSTDTVTFGFLNSTYSNWDTISSKINLNGTHKVMLETSSSFNSNIFRMHGNEVNGNSLTSRQVSNIMILEGDWTDKEVPTYIDGIKSIGDYEDNKVNILSRNTDSTIEDKREILLPMENGLKSLPNGVKDELIDNGEVIQRIGLRTLIGNENWNNNRTLNDNSIRHKLIVSNAKPQRGDIVSTISNNVISVPDNIMHIADYGVSIHPVRGELDITMPKSKLSTPDVNGFKQWLRENPTTVYYELETPIIHKNIDVFNLNTYEDITHITTDNVVKGNISGTSNINLGGYISKQEIKIDSLEKEVKSNRQDTDNLLHNTVNFNELPFEGENITIKNSLLGETKDLTIEGRTLHNLSKIKNGSTNIGRLIMIDTYHILKVGTKYTISADVTTTNINTYKFYIVYSDGTEGQYLNTSGRSFKHTFIPDKESVKVGIYLTPGDYDEGARLAADNILIIEEDLTNKEIPDYFTGIKSVGELNDNKINIISNGKNLFDMNNNIRKGPHVVINNNYVTASATGNLYDIGLIPNHTNIKPNTKYTITVEILENTLNDSLELQFRTLNRPNLFPNLNWYIPTGITGVHKVLAISDSIISNKYILNTKMTPNCKTGHVTYKIYLEEGDFTTSKELYKEDKKEIILPITDGLKSIGNIKDEIKNNTEVLQKINKIILDGSETNEFRIASAEEAWGDSNSIAFRTHLPNEELPNDIPVNSEFACISNNFSGLSANSMFGNKNIRNSICLHSNAILIFRIDRDKLNTLDVNGFKNWLRENPTTVYYKMRTPIIHKLDDLDINLKTYLNTTHISTDSLIKPNIKGKSLVNVNKSIKSNLDTIDVNFIEIDSINKRTIIEETIKEDNTNTNHVQQEEIDMSMESTVELFEMIILGYSSEKELPVNKTNTSMIKAYASLIKKGKKTIEEVPEIIRDNVNELI